MSGMPLLRDLSDLHKRAFAGSWRSNLCASTEFALYVVSDPATLWVIGTPPTIAALGDQLRYYLLDRSDPEEAAELEEIHEVALMSVVHWGPNPKVEIAGSYPVFTGVRNRAVGYSFSNLHAFTSGEYFLCEDQQTLDSTKAPLVCEPDQVSSAFTASFQAVSACSRHSAGIGAFFSKGAQGQDRAVVFLASERLPKLGPWPSNLRGEEFLRICLSEDLDRVADKIESAARALSVVDTLVAHADDVLLDDVE